MQDEWELMYQANAREVFQFLMYFTGSREDAEDLTQETFLKVARKIGQFGRRSDLKTWVISIAKNLAIDQIRRRQRSQMIQRVLRVQWNAHAELPEELASQNESKRALYKAIQKLNHNYRAVVILRGIQDLTPAETALVLGWNQEKVNLAYHRALKSLRAKMTESGGDAEWIIALRTSR